MASTSPPSRWPPWAALAGGIGAPLASAIRREPAPGGHPGMTNPAVRWPGPPAPSR
jgi:hypothetical protein